MGLLDAKSLKIRPATDQECGKLSVHSYSVGYHTVPHMSELKYCCVQTKHITLMFHKLQSVAVEYVSICVNCCTLFAAIVCISSQCRSPILHGFEHFRTFADMMCPQGCTIPYGVHHSIMQTSAVDTHNTVYYLNGP